MILTLFRRFAERGFDGDWSGGGRNRGEGKWDGGRDNFNDTNSGSSSSWNDGDDDDDSFVERLLIKSSRQHRVAIIVTAVFSIVASAFVIWTIWYDNRSKRVEDAPKKIPERLRYDMLLDA